jgi:hypothetical protein
MLASGSTVPKAVVGERGPAPARFVIQQDGSTNFGVVARARSE